MSRKDIKHVFRQFRVSHETLCITAINFDTQSLMGYVELTVHPLSPDLKRLKLNSKQCRIYRCSVNDHYEANFSYNDTTLEVCQGESKQRQLSFFNSSHLTAVTSVDADCSNGELLVKLPPEVIPLVQDLKSFRLTVEFSLEQPKGGIKFVVADIDGTLLDRGAHLFSYGVDNSSRLWFPCVDSYSEVCTWKLEFTVEMYMTAVSCGDLIETVYTSDLRKKTYHYFLSTPTSASNIGLAVGPFEIHIDPFMHEVTHFCLPHLLPVLKHSVATVHEAFEFYEELLSSRYPFTCYKQVFVDHAFADYRSYSSLSIFSTNLLFTKKVIDQVPISRQVMAQALSEQFFGCYIAMNSWSDAWLPKGISRYLQGQYVRKAFGNNEYRFQLAQDMETVSKYEEEIGSVLLDTSVDTESNVHFSNQHPHTLSPLYVDVYQKKSHLVVRMLEIRLGKELLLQVLNKLLTLASAASIQKITSNTWGNMLLSTMSFLKVLTTLTGKDIQSFLEQWIHSSGVARFVGNFVFNRKRNVVELELRQDHTTKGTLKYVGPLTVTIQELDGTFTHPFQIEENKTKFEINCHSKSRRHKKKKIPLCTGEEIDMDLNEAEADSPVLWIRIDPDMAIIRSVKLEQPDYMWQLMLKHERCVIAQLNSITALVKYPTMKTKAALTDIVENERCFYQVRIQATYCLAQVVNGTDGQWGGATVIINLFQKLFGSPSCPHIVRQNDFNNFQQYFLQKAMPLAISTIRNVSAICPSEVLYFLLDLLKYNDNSKNTYTDCYYRAALIEALANTVTSAVQVVTVTPGVCSTSLLTPDTQKILDELFRALNMEKLVPSYKLVVTISCLQSIRRLQKFGHLPNDSSLFMSYISPGNYLDVRIAAVDALVDFVKVDGCQSTLDYLLELVTNDHEPLLSHHVIQALCANPPFTKQDGSPLNCEALVDSLWHLMNSKLSYDTRLRCDMVDLYFTLFGKGRPACLPVPDSVMVLDLKKKRTVLHPSLTTPDMSSVFPTTSPFEEHFKRKLEPVASTSFWNYGTESIASPSQKKIKIKMGNISDDAASAQSFKAVDSPEVHLDTDMPEARPSWTEAVSGGGHGAFKPSISMDESSQISRLSESSDSNSIPTVTIKPEEQSFLPTSFTSDMFSSPLSASDESQKLHKKKKKKNKKHKHKKDREVATL